MYKSNQRVCRISGDTTRERDLIAVPFVCGRHLNWHVASMLSGVVTPHAGWREREREREIQIVHSASLAYEDESVFTFCALLRMAVRQWLTAF